ncbi:OprD family outer membrane porin [Pseudomonas putida]
MVWLGQAQAITREDCTLTFYRAELKDNYHQKAASLLYKTPLSESVNLKADLRYFDSDDQGWTNVDNHSLGLGYQNQSGDTGLPYRPRDLEQRHLPALRPRQRRLLATAL